MKKEQLRKYRWSFPLHVSPVSNNLLTTVQVEGWILVLLLAIKVPLVIFTSSPLKSFCWLYFCSPPPLPQHFSQLFCNEVVNHMNRYLILFGFYLLQNILIEWFPITLIKSSYEKKGISLSFFVSSVKWSLLSVMSISSAEMKHCILFTLFTWKWLSTSGKIFSCVLVHPFLLPFQLLFYLFQIIVVSIAYNTQDVGNKFIQQRIIL